MNNREYIKRMIPLARAAGQTRKYFNKLNGLESSPNCKVYDSMAWGNIRHYWPLRESVTPVNNVT